MWLALAGGYGTAPPMPVNALMASTGTALNASAVPSDRTGMDIHASPALADRYGHLLLSHASVNLATSGMELTASFSVHPDR